MEKNLKGSQIQPILKTHCFIPYCAASGHLLGLSWLCKQHKQEKALPALKISVHVELKK